MINIIKLDGFIKLPICLMNYFKHMKKRIKIYLLNAEEDEIPY